MKIGFTDELPHLLAAMTWTHTFAFGHWPPFNPVIWSLETEIQFYLLAPLLLTFLYSNRNATARYGKFILLAAVTLYLQSMRETMRTWHLHMSILTNLHYFLVGFLIAEVYITRRHLLDNRSFSWDLVGFGAFYLLFRQAWNDNQTFFCIALLLLFITIFKGRILHRFCTTRAVYVIGGMCYTIYLLHYPLFHFVGRFTTFVQPFGNFYANLLVQALLIFPPVLAMGSVFFLLFEKPCMSRKPPEVTTA